jgi:4-diphosphocytidyl-2-C-methyl-D-erythritol kinase
MTGTGACVFAGFDNQEQAEQVMASLPAQWQGFVAKACNQSPLIHCLESNISHDSSVKC